MKRYPYVISFATVAVLFLAWFGLQATAQAQTQCPVSMEARQNASPIAENRGAAALWEALTRLHTRASMLMFTAHPDDEDGGMLAYESRHVGARVALMTLNRGEGGANIMSSDLWDALGLVRTEELLQADRYYCVQQYFSVAADYGFSKTLAEALQKWPRDKVFYDAVRVVRLTRPLIVTSVFVGGPSDGHGNHAAAGMFAQQVLNAAGDPNVFPDQIREGLLPWTPVKEYARVPFSLEQGHVSPKGLYDYATHHWMPAGVQNYVTGKFEPGGVATTVSVPEGKYSSVVGLDYQQISRTGLGFQKSQNGGGQIPPPGPDLSNYHRFGSHIAASNQEASFYDGIDISLAGIATLAGNEPHAFLNSGLATMNSLVESAMKNYRAVDPGAIAGTLAQGLKLTDSLIEKVQDSGLSARAKYDVSHELRVKRAEFNDALTLALGVTLNANVAPDHPLTGMFARFVQYVPSFQMAIPDQRFTVKVHIANAGTLPVMVKAISLQGQKDENWHVEAEGSTSRDLGSNKVVDALFHVQVPVGAAYTEPYFTRPDIEQPYYDIAPANSQYRNLPFAPYPLEAWVTLQYDGADLHLGEVVQTVKDEVGPGTLLYPMPVGPAISVTMLQSAGIVPLEKKSFSLDVRIHSNVKGPAQGALHLQLPEGWSSQPAVAAFSLAHDGQDQTLSFQIRPASLTSREYHIEAVAEYQNKQYKQGYVETGYTGLRPYFLYKAASYKTTGVDVKVAPGMVVGYIEGSGDDVPQSLDNIGIHVRFLTADDLASGDLAKYNLILVGVRAYAVRPDLRTYNRRLMDYVQQGGVVVVQYQTPEFDHDFGPYPYTMTSDPEEVTDEHSKVVLLDPSNPVLSWPNVITEKDFDNWIEERGSKFMESWDPHYKALLETHDPGQAPQKGGLLVAQYGAGVYVYTAYAFYRELPLGVPGAYRIFANLVSLPASSLVHRKALPGS